LSLSAFVRPSADFRVADFPTVAVTGNNPFVMMIRAIASTNGALVEKNLREFLKQFVNGDIFIVGLLK
jgi:hypothetical protein